MKEKCILITGGTGSLGKSLIKQLLNTGKTIVSLNRDEASQASITRDPEFRTDQIVLHLGDIRDKDSLTRLFKKYEFESVIHAAALKHVNICEEHPSECIDTNLGGSRNILQFSMNHGVKRVVLVSTDKAAMPNNAYGLSKALMEKLIADYDGVGGMSVNATRFGNLMGSRGSVLEIFLKQIKATGKITLTDPEMTRFWIRVETAAETALMALKVEESGIILVPKMRSCSMADFVDAVFSFAQVKKNVVVVGKRPGENKHEYIIGPHEVDKTTQAIGFHGYAIARKTQARPLLKAPIDSETSEKMQADEVLNMILSSEAVLA